MAERESKQRNVIEIGSPVNIGTADDPIHAVIQAVSLRGPHGAVAQYECVWWDGKTRKSEWVGEDEIVQASKPIAAKMSIGFAPAG
jgi:uncharacterized protein YodC (DUF2158 family)